MMKVSVVIPAHNEEKRIGPVLSEIEKMGLEFFVVDDGSKDNTAGVAGKYTPNVLRHRINLGKGAALKTGCEAAFDFGADAVVVMDSDGQHKASDLPKFVAALKKCDVVLGERDFGETPTVRLIGNKLISFLVNLFFGIRVGDILCGYKAFTKKAYRKINWSSLGYSVETEIVAMTGKYRLKHCQVPVTTVYYDKFKGLTAIAGLEILFDVLRFKLR